tara:strand:+ start:132 stop:494 length:363 start_codon:yes stop_codon:yes gene_type:complete
MAFKQRSSGPFKMMGASPAKQGVWNTTKKVFGVAGKALKKYFYPVTAVTNAPLFGEKHGLKKYAGAMVWDKNLFLNKDEAKETWAGGNKMYTPSTPNKDNASARQIADKDGDVFNKKSLR